VKSQARGNSKEQDRGKLRQSRSSGPYLAEVKTLLDRNHAGEKIRKYLGKNKKTQGGGERVSPGEKTPSRLQAKVSRKRGRGNSARARVERRKKPKSSKVRKNSTVAPKSDLRTNRGKNGTADSPDESIRIDSRKMMKKSGTFGREALTASRSNRRGKEWLNSN